MSEQHIQNNSPRIYLPLKLHAGDVIELPAGATRHVQVLRMQPEQSVTLFNGEGGEWQAHILEMGKNRVTVNVAQHFPIEREAKTKVSLLIGVPVNERMDFLIEKTTELGVFEIYPMMFERSVFRLNSSRAERKLEQWKTIITSACEQCGRNHVPKIHPMQTINELLQKTTHILPLDRRVLSFNNVLPWASSNEHAPVCILSGPEGGLSQKEEELLIAEAAFKPYSLGNRVLRADTAPIAALSYLTL